MVVRSMVDRTVVVRSIVDRTSVDHSMVVRTVVVAQWWIPRHSGSQCGWNVKRFCFPPLFWATFMGGNPPLLQLGIKAGEII